MKYIKFPLIFLDAFDDSRFVYTQRINNKWITFLLVTSIFAGEITFVCFVLCQSAKRVRIVRGKENVNIFKRLKLGLIEAFGLTPYFFKDRFDSEVFQRRGAV